MKFTSEEINLMCIYDTGTRAGLRSELTEMRGMLGEDETELRELADCVLAKLDRMTDAEYAALSGELIPDWEA